MVFNPCHHYHVRLGRTSSSAAGGGGCARPGRGAVAARPSPHYPGTQSFPPSGITSGVVLLSLPLPGNSVKRPAYGAVTASWMVSVSLPSGGKSCPHDYGARCVRVPLLPRAPRALLRCRIDSSAHFPRENLDFFSPVSRSPDHWSWMYTDSFLTASTA